MVKVAYGLCSIFDEMYMALAGVWIWGLLVAARNRPRGLIVSLVLALLLDVALAF